jgi:hypothetical protein
VSPRARLALLVLSGYVAVAFCVGNLYPFSVFDMYSRPAESGSRLAARRGARVEEVTRYRSWSCESEIDLDAQRCGRGVRTSDPVDHELYGWIRDHAGSGGEPVELVRRIWFFSRQGVRVEDCLLSRCRAVHQ